MTTLLEVWRRGARGTPRRQIVSEAMLTFTVGVGLIAVGLVHTSGTPVVDISSRWVFILPLSVLCLLMLVKRSRPVTALGAGTVAFVGDALMGGSVGALLAYIDLIYSVALHARRTVARRIEVLVWVIMLPIAVLVFVLSGDLRGAVLLALVLFALFVTPMWWGRAVRTQADLARLAVARNEDLQRLTELRETEVLRGERTRMAGELHDALAGNLAAIGIHAEAALAGPEGTPPPRSSLTAIREASVSASDELRAMVRLLRSGEDERTAPARLAEIAGPVDQARHRGLTVEVDHPEPWPDLPAAVDHAAHRIVQEALTNAAKHAPGAAVQVGIAVTDGHLDLRADNTLAPLPSGGSAGDGLGLLGMQERAEALGGTFHAGPSAGSWRVRASIPLPPHEGRTP